MARHNRLFSLWRSCIGQSAAHQFEAYSWRQSVVNIPSTHGSADAAARIGLENVVGNRPTLLKLLIGPGLSELLLNSYQREHEVSSFSSIEKISPASTLMLRTRQERPLVSLSLAS
jgi:hypothetical protein